MRIVIERVNENTIGAFKDFSDIKSRGEISHIIAELETIKLELIDYWKKWDD